MEEFMLGLIWLGFFAACFFAWFYYLQARTKERTLLIEKGADASNFYGKKPERRGFRFPWMKLGLLFVGIAFGLGLGLIIISIPSASFINHDVAPGLVIAFTLVFGGIGMISAHFVDRKKENKAL